MRAAALRDPTPRDDPDLNDEAEAQPSPVIEFIRTEAGSGMILVLSAIAALVWANSRWSDDYDRLLHASVQIGTESFNLTMSLQHWVNDALMVVFFLIVGLEIKRELLIGELSSLANAAIPVAAALGGAILPAVLYLLVVPEDGRRGWGIPMATDIAFALGILALVAGSAPIGLRVFLMALAIVDDLIAIVVIAVFYTADLRVNALLIAGVCLAILVAMNRLGIEQPSFFFMTGVALWLALLKSGVHPTIAGVLIAMCVPVTGRSTFHEFFERVERLVHARSRTGDDEHDGEIVELIEHQAERVTPPAQRLIHALHPWVAYLIIPVFALANAGVDLQGISLDEPISRGVLVGLLVGKSVGITLAVALMLRFGIGSLPHGMRLAHVPGIATLAGIGFTMSLFVSDLAFISAVQIDEAKIGILAASVLAAVAGSIAIRLPKQPRTQST